MMCQSGTVLLYTLFRNERQTHHIHRLLLLTVYAVPVGRVYVLIHLEQPHVHNAAGRLPTICLAV
eukprot:47672-Eustigmatos_ZCMA.PRE.1